MLRLFRLALPLALQFLHPRSDGCEVVCRARPLFHFVSFPEAKAGRRFWRAGRFTLKLPFNSLTCSFCLFFGLRCGRHITPGCTVSG
jgi:hypothetical protein